jgi:hypothetical protein
MNRLFARSAVAIAVIPLSVLCGACAHQTAAPSATAMAHPAQPAAAGASERPARGVTALQAKNSEDLPSARSTMDLSGAPSDSPPGTTRADEDLARAARHALLGDTELQHCASLQVTASGGKVTLHGTVETALQRLSAVATVAAVPGVYEVDEELTATQPPDAVPVVAESSSTKRGLKADEHNLVAR